MFKYMFLAVLFSFAAMAYDDQPRTDYETVAAGQTLQICGPNGRQGDILDKLIIIPGTTSPGAVSVSDDSNISVFAGGANSVNELRPMIVELGMRAISAAGFRVTTGSNVTAICVGRFK